MIDAEISWHVDLWGYLNTPLRWTTTLNFSSGSAIPPGYMFIKTALGKYDDRQDFPFSNEHPFIDVGIMEVTSGGITQRFPLTGNGKIYSIFQAGVSRAVVGGVAKNAEGAMVYSAQHWA